MSKPYYYKAREDPSPKPQPKAEGRKTYGDFKEELVGKKVVVRVRDGETYVGEVLEARAYWIKLWQGSGVLYINKAHIKTIQPVAESDKK